LGNTSARPIHGARKDCHLLLSPGNRLPPRQDLLLVFSGCAFLIHIWAIINMFYIIPAWVLRMNLAQLSGAIAYILVFALLESLLIWGLLALLAVLLPQSLLRQNFVAQGMMLALLTAIFSIMVHFNYEFLVANRGYLLALTIIYLPCAAVCHFLAGRYRKIDAALRGILDRLTVLTGLYIFFDLVSLMIVIMRNIT
jgi:hypothetical protein